MLLALFGWLFFEIILRKELDNKQENSFSKNPLRLENICYEFHFGCVYVLQPSFQ